MNRPMVLRNSETQRVPRVSGDVQKVFLKSIHTFEPLNVLPLVYE